MMPDGSEGCQRILDHLRTIESNQQLMRDMHISHAASVATDIGHLKAKMEAIEESTTEIRTAAARRDGMFDGAIWTLAKVGTAATMFMAFVGWMTTGGGWQWIKEHF